MSEELPSLAASRHRDRQSSDPALIRAILTQAMIVHLGFIRDGWPVVLPFHFGLGDPGDGRGEQLIIHGSTGGRAFLDAALETGVPVSACISLNDGLVLGRSVYETGARYRSVVAYGYARRLPAAYRQAGLDILMNHVIPGRVDEVRPPSAKELDATALLGLPLDHAAAKVADTNTGDTPGDGEDRAIWAGIVPLRLVALPPVPSPETAGSTQVPASVRAFLAVHQGYN